MTFQIQKRHPVLGLQHHFGYSVVSQQIRQPHLVVANSVAQAHSLRDVDTGRGIGPPGLAPLGVVIGLWGGVDQRHTATVEKCCWFCHSRCQDIQCKKPPTARGVGDHLEVKHCGLGYSGSGISTCCPSIDSVDAAHKMHGADSTKLFLI